jgi:thiosulfate/3-mercaptopyruvate sulfurtransferase
MLHQRRARFNLDRADFPLLSDEGGRLIEQLEIKHERGTAKRTTFVVDAAGKVRAVFPNVKVDGHADEVLAAVRQLQGQGLARAWESIQLTAQDTYTGYLVTAQWLRDHLADPTVRVVDTRGPELYEAGHIPGAVFVDVRNLHLTDGSPAAHGDWIARLEAAFAEAGITEQHEVVFYEEAFGEIAARGVWVLSYLGHSRAHLLDGGLNAWLAAGYPTTAQASHVPRASFHAQPRPELIATGEYILQHLNDPAVRLLDVRRATEYAGAEVRARRAGHIPGAIHLEWLNSLTEDGRFKEPAALAQIYGGLVLDAGTTIIPYCQHGYRSANTWLALTLLGYTRVRNYVGSWDEWGNRDGMPVATPASVRHA